VVLDFPLPTDTSHTLEGGDYYWNAGDYVDGSRTTTLASTTSATIYIAVENSLSSCGQQDMEMLINGIVVGNFVISSGETSVSATFTYAAIAGPTYDLRYQTTATVASGCGSAGFATSGSTVTLQ